MEQLEERHYHQTVRSTKVGSSPTFLTAVNIIKKKVFRFKAASKQAQACSLGSTFHPLELDFLVNGAAVLAASRRFIGL